MSLKKSGGWGVGWGVGHFGVLKGMSRNHAIVCEGNKAKIKYLECSVLKARRFHWSFTSLEVNQNSLLQQLPCLRNCGIAGALLKYAPNLPHFSTEGLREQYFLFLECRTAEAMVTRYLECESIPLAPLFSGKVFWNCSDDFAGEFLTIKPNHIPHYEKTTVAKGL